MGLSTTLEDENGVVLARVDDPRNFVGPLMPSPDDPTFPMLTAIDLYGDTKFNRIQVPRFIREWAFIAARFENAAARALHSDIMKMANEAIAGPHRYLCFYGD